MCTLRGHREIFLKYYAHRILSLKVVLILANSAEHDEMQHGAAFYLGIHFLTKYPFKGFHVYKFV